MISGGYDCTSVIDNSNPDQPTFSLNTFRVMLRNPLKDGEISKQNFTQHRVLVIATYITTKKKEKHVAYLLSGITEAQSFPERIEKPIQIKYFPLGKDNADLLMGELGRPANSESNPYHLKSQPSGLYIKNGVEFKEAEDSSATPSSNDQTPLPQHFDNPASSSGQPFLGNKSGKSRATSDTITDLGGNEEDFAQEASCAQKLVNFCRCQ